MSGQRRLFSVAAVSLGLALTLALVWLVSVDSVRADPTIRCVNQTGTGCGGACGGCYAAVQAALDAAAVGDVVRVAGGTYTDTAGTVATIVREVVIEGGYDPACDQWDGDLYHTVLDAGGNGSVVRITSAGDVVLHHLTLTGGDGTGNCGADGCGGGVYVGFSTLHMGYCGVVHNVGGSAAGRAMGGGIYAKNSAVEIWNSHIMSNTAGTAATGDHFGYGGGLYLQGGTAVLRLNEIGDNLGSAPYSGSGGVHLDMLTHAELLTNTIWGNRGNQSSYWSSGGGVKIEYSSDVLVSGNTIVGNTAGHLSGIGGGVFVNDSQAHLTRNTIADNSGGTAASQGDGVCLRSDQPITLTNNLIVHNIGAPVSEGVYVERGGAPPTDARLINNTIAHNGTYGIIISQYSDVHLTNNLVAGQTMGVTQTHPSGGLVADTNLWWNSQDPIVGSNPVLADPRLTPSYQLRPGSAALDAGLPIPWLTVDLLGHPRPEGSGWDIGAFEGAVAYEAVLLPLVVNQVASGPTLIFADDFNDGDLVGWTPNYGTWTNPGTHMQGVYTTGNAWNIRAESGADFVYSGTLTLVSGNAVGLVFRSSADGTSSYDVILDAVDDVFKISKRAPYTILDDYEMTVELGHPYQVRVEASGSTIEAYLDGVKRLTVTDTTYTSGRLGAMVFMATATFDNLEAWEQP